MDLAKTPAKTGITIKVSATEAYHWVVKNVGPVL